MIRKFTPLDDYFRKAAVDYEERPSADVWQNIVQQLPETATSSVSWRRWFFVAAGLLLGILLRLPLHETPLRRAGHAVTVTSTASPAMPVWPGLKRLQKRQRLAFTAAHPFSVRSASLLPQALSLSFPGTAVTLTARLDRSSTDRLFKSMTRPARNLLLSRLNQADQIELQKQAAPVDADDNPFDPHWSVTPLVEYRLAQYRLDNDQTNQDYKNIIARRESHEPSFSIGFHADFHYAKHWSIGTGLEYQSIAIGIGSQTLYASNSTAPANGFKYITSSGYSYLKPDFGTISSGDSVHAGAAQHQLSFLSVPLNLTYQLSGRHWEWSVALGAGFNYLLRARVETELIENNNKELLSVRRLDGMNPFFLSTQAGIAAGYRMDAHWTLQARTSFSYALTAINRNNVVKTFPYSFGAGFGAVYNF